MTRLLTLLLVVVLLSGCNMPYLQRVPYFSSLWSGQPEADIAPKHASIKPVAPPVAETPVPPAAVSVPPLEKAVPPVVGKEMPVQVPAPAASQPAPPAEKPAPRIRPASGIAPDRSYEGVFLTEDTTWSGVISVKDGVTVAPQTTLTVEPGTTIRFLKKATLVVQGRLSANGTVDRPVRFTSDFAQPEPGDWQGIVLLGSEKNNLLEHCIIEGADVGLNAAFSRISLKNSSFTTCRTGARFDDSYVTIRNGSFSKSGIGVHARDSELDLRETDVSANRQGLLGSSSSVSVERSSLFGNREEAIILIDSRLGINGVTIAGNGTGMVFDRCQGSVVGSRIVNNVGIGVRAGHSRLRMTGNELADNAGVGLHATEGAVIAWSNVFTGNGGFDLYNGGKTEVNVIGNWWGEGTESEFASRIHGQHLDPDAGPVKFLPLLRARPSARP